MVILPHFHKPTITDIVPGNPAYASFPWAATCMREQVNRQADTYYPFRLWGVAESHGQCINNDASELGVVRRTINPANPACADRVKVKVWVFGGSAVYGTLIPDWATLPSALSRLLNNPSRCVEVTNFGVEGYNSNQELLLLLEQLKSGHTPDVVILYDGFNDADAGTSPAGPAAHLRYMTVKRRMESRGYFSPDFLNHFAIRQLGGALTRSKGRKEIPRVPDDQLPARAAATLDNYLKNVKLVRKLGETYGFKVCAFWQPAIIYGSKPLVPYEREFLDLSFQPAFGFQPLAPVYQEAERRSQGGQFHFLGHVLDTETQPLYLDWVHLNPAGNEIVAKTVASLLAGCLQ
jgi:lysophospholipase L1-like esterase